MLRSRCRYEELGEIPSGYFLNLENRNFMDKVITKLVDINHYVFRLILNKKKKVIFFIKRRRHTYAHFFCYCLPKLSNSIYSLKFYQITTPSFTILVKTRK